jgi:hypothetical protein
MCALSTEEENAEESMANSRETTQTKFTFDDCRTHTAQCDCTDLYTKQGI